MKVINFFFLSVVLFVSCKEKRSDYKYMLEKTIHGVSIKVYLVDENFEDSTMNFLLKLSTPNGTNPLEYGIKDKNEYLKRVYYYSYQIENDIWLIQDGKKLQSAGAVFQRDYNLSKEVVINVHFNGVVKGYENKIVVYPRLYNIIPVKFILK